MSIADYTEAELRAELARRRAPMCQCGTRRHEVIDTKPGFYDRTGCMTCNLWDGPPRLNGARTC